MSNINNMSKQNNSISIEEKNKRNTKSLAVWTGAWLFTYFI